MRAAVSRLDPWAPPLVLVAVIWFFSSQPDLSSGLGVIDLVGRKMTHAGEYALLCFLWWRALRGRLAGRTALGLAFTLAVAYGAVDEYHQTLVAGRNGSPIDVGIDALGAALAVLAIRYRLERPRGQPSEAEPSDRRAERASA
jgi:VanZ family protein